MMTSPTTFQACGRTTETLPPGGYSCMLDNCGNAIFQVRDLKTDDYIRFPDSISATVLDEIRRFWDTGDRFARYGYLHRRGYLFYGKQGCGKSSLIGRIVSDIISDGHAAFFCQHPYYFVRCMEKFREVEPARPIVCIFEDIDAIIANYGDADLLQWLDGNHQVDKVVNLASTNYPEKLDRRIVSRPRRFDRILRIDAPDARTREAYFSKKVSELTPAEVSQWVELTEGLPFAALAEMVISVRCLGNGLEETAKLLRAIDEHNPTSLEFAGAAQSENGDEE
jgi:AAA+ superfamily predicted ATPase